MSRPQYVAFPSDPKGFTIDDQYYVGGSGLLVKPVTTEGQTEVEVYVPDNQVCHLCCQMEASIPDNLTNLFPFVGLL